MGGRGSKPAESATPGERHSWHCYIPVRIARSDDGGIGDCRWRLASRPARGTDLSLCPLVPTAAPPGESESKCPVRSKKPVSGDQCPVRYKNPNVYNVYGEKLDPSNLMPATAQQLPTPGQEKPLSTDRVVSGIAKGGTDSTWVYPSPQMFYNSLMRKGKGADVKADDVHAMVAIHNNMNEKTWKEVLFWEKFHCKECDDPRLLRFEGRPDDLSPLARVRMLMGRPAPFDRHDWVVDRCGTEVRYIIDYYHDDALPVDKSLPKQFDFSSNTQITLDVRPAVDSVGAVWDRLRLAWGLVPEAPEGWPGNILASQPSANEPLPAAKPWTKKQKAFMDRVNAVAVKCQDRIQELKRCENPIDCERKTMAKDVCVGELVCPREVKAFMKVLENPKSSEEETFKAYGSLLKCNSKFQEDGEKLFN